MAGYDSDKEFAELIHKIILLNRISVHDLLHRCKSSDVTRFWADLLSGQRILSVVQRNFEHLARVKVSRVGLEVGHAGNARFDTSADAPVPGFLQGVSQREQMRNIGAVVKERRMASSFSGDRKCQSEGLFVHTVMIAEGHTRFFCLQILHAVENQSGQFIAAVSAVRQNAADHHMNPQRASRIGDGLPLCPHFPEFSNFQLELVNDICFRFPYPVCRKDTYIGQNGPGSYRCCCIPSAAPGG